MLHPLAIGIVLLFQTLIICLLAGLIAQRYWFSYVLFLVFLGGLLVLFIYVTRLASNEIFSLSTKMILTFSAPLILAILIILFIDLLPTIINYFNSDLTPISGSSPYQEETSLTLIKLYNEYTSLITLILVIYLFLTLLAVVNVTNIFNGPLREKN